MSLAEAQTLLDQAEKHLNNKTMLFKKSPEYDKAADCFQKAAQIFRSPTVKAFDKAVSALERAAQAHASNGVHFSAATALENAGNILRDSKEPAKAADMYKRAVELYQRCNNVEKACDSLLKAAKAVADVDVDRAIALYLEAIELLVSEERHVFVGDTWRNCLALMLRNARLDDAVKLLERMFPIFEKLEQPEYLRKAQLSVVVIKLTQSDVGAAGQACDAYGDFALSAEGGAARELIEAFEAGDADKVKAVASEQTFTLLENQVARLAAKLRDVCLSQEEDLTGARGGVRPSAGGTKVFQLHELDGGDGGGGGSAAAEEEDELC